MLDVLDGQGIKVGGCRGGRAQQAVQRCAGKACGCIHCAPLLPCLASQQSLQSSQRGTKSLQEQTTHRKLWPLQCKVRQVLHCAEHAERQAIIPSVFCVNLAKLL